MVFQDYFNVTTTGRDIYEITSTVANIISKTSIRIGLCNVFIHHTSASLIILENADPSVKKDLERYMSLLVKEGDPMFQHVTEGKDDMPAHIRTVLTQTSISMPVSQGQLVLGQWQGLFLWEHRLKSFDRRVTVTIVGDEF